MHQICSLHKKASQTINQDYSHGKNANFVEFFSAPSCPQHLYQNLYDFWRPRIQLGCRKLIQFNIIGNSRLLCCWNLFETIFFVCFRQGDVRRHEISVPSQKTQKKLNRFIERKRRNIEDRFRKTSHCRWSLLATSKLMCHVDHLSMSIKAISNNLLCESKTACPSYPFRNPLK